MESFGQGVATQSRQNWIQGGTGPKAHTHLGRDPSMESFRQGWATHPSQNWGQGGISSQNHGMGFFVRPPHGVSSRLTVP